MVYVPYRREKLFGESLRGCGYVSNTRVIRTGLCYERILPAIWSLLLTVAVGDMLQSGFPENGETGWRTKGVFLKMVRLRAMIHV